MSERKNKYMLFKNRNKLNKAYKMVYEDLCKNHTHVMATFNETLHSDDIRPTHNQVNKMIQDIVNHGKAIN